MPRLAICSVPKAFIGHSEVIQRNALSSWARVPDSEILLLGDDEGVDVAAARIGASHLPDISRNASGTPLLDDVFRKIRDNTSAEAICYVNADIVLPAAVSSVPSSLPFPSYLVVGRRVELRVETLVDFGDARAAGEFWVRARTEGTRGSQWAVDYFIYPRTTDWELPAFALGRTAWDNWIIWKARASGTPVVDATEAIEMVHQDHDYGRFGTKEGVWSSEEASLNQELAGLERLFTVLDATHVLGEAGLRRAFSYPYLREHLLNWPIRRQVGRKIYGKVIQASRRLRGIEQISSRS